MDEERQEGDGAMEEPPMAAPGLEAPRVAAQMVAAPAIAAPTVETPVKALPTVTINSGSRREKVTGFALGLREIEALVPRFEPGDRKTLSAAAWFDTVSAIFQQYGVRDEHAVLMASMRLKGAAKSWFEGMRGNLHTWEIFGEALKEFFPGEIDNLAIHQKLREGKKRRSETAEEYCYGKMALAQQIQLDFNTLTSYIVAGIQDPNLRSILSTSRYDSLPEIVLTINRHEASQNLDRRSRDHRREDRHSNRRDSRRDERRGERRDYRRGRSPRRREEHHARRERSRSHRREGSRSRGRNRFFRQNERYGRYGRNEDRRDVSRAGRRRRWDDRRVKDERNGKGVSKAKKGLLCYICRSAEHLARACPKGGDFRQRLVEHPASRKLNNRMHKMVLLEGMPCEALVDTGSDLTLVTEEEAQRCKLRKTDEGTAIRAYGGTQQRTQWSTSARVQVDEVSRVVTIHVVSGNLQQTSMILGANFLTAEGIVSKIQDGEVCVEEVPIVKEITTKKEKPKVTEEDIKFGDVATSETRMVVVEVLNKRRGAVALDTMELGVTSVGSMTIKLKEDKVIKRLPYRVPVHYLKHVKEELKRLLEMGVIEETRSEFASPMIIVRKKCGDIRLCVDYRELNAVTVKEYYPLPRIEEELHRLEGKKVFTSLDLLMGYYQVPVDEASRKYTAFSTPFAHYQFRRMPFGLANSPAVFMRVMEEVLKPLNSPDILCFVDDILIATETVQENVMLLEKILEKLEQCGLTVKVKKCEFMSSTITFLGHEISNGELMPGAVKIDAVAKCLPPQNVTAVRQFLGLTGYFRRFVKDYTIISQPLRMLLKKKTPWQWGSQQEESFNKLKEALTTHPVLKLYSPEAETELHCDASKYGLGAVLMQKDPSGNLQPVGYFSRATTDTETRYPSCELEAMAVVEGMERFKYFLLGKHFTVVTDCSALQYVHAKKELTPRLARWWMRIMPYDFTVSHRAGNEMCHADFLSRNPVGTPIENKVPTVLTVGLTGDDWIAALQYKDVRLDKIRHILRAKPDEYPEGKKVHEDFCLSEERLYRRTPQGKRFVVPCGLKFYVMRAAHDDTGHPALERSIKNIENHYWFPRLRRLVKKYLSNCVKCSVSKAGLDENRHTWHVVNKTPIPFHVVHVDFCGPFPKATGGREYIVGVIDAFTRYTVLRAVTAPTARNAIKVLEEIAQYFGYPAVLVSDNGTSFTANMFREFCEDNGIHHSPVSVATPRANGQIERVFRVVKDSLKCLSTSQAGGDWVVHLPTVQWAINSSENRVTQETPQRLLMGYTPRNTLGNQLLHAISAAVEREDESIIPFAEVRTAAARRMLAHQEKQAKIHNMTTHSPVKYQVGDLVLVRFQPPATGTTRKLTPKFRGPYIVEKVLPYDRYTVVDLPTGQVTRKRFTATYPADLLKRCGIMEDLRDLEGEFEGEKVGDDELLSEE